MGNPLDQFRLQGRTAIVSGGSKGLGASIAEALAYAGADLVLVSRHRDEAVHTASRISDLTGRSAVGWEADVSDEAAADRVITETLDEFGRLDILVNSAGINVRGAIEDISRSDFDRSMAVNVTGTWLMCRSAGRVMRAAGYGRVVNLASVFGMVGAPNRSAYASSKGAVVVLTKALALEWALDGVTVNALAPGPFLTEMNLPFRDSDHAVRVISHEVAMQRWGEIPEIQGAALFLASDASSYVTGSVLTVDGGWMAH